MIVFPFQPSPNEPFSFQATLDGNVYNISVPWLLFGRRYYVQCADLNGNLIFFQALVGSPTGITIQSMSWDANVVTIVTASPHKYRTGKTLKVTVAGCSPDAYNGTFIALATGPNTITYPLAGDPGSCMVAGRVDQNINMAGPYFKKSSLVYRQDSQQFEVTP